MAARARIVTAGINLGPLPNAPDSAENVMRNLAHAASTVRPEHKESFNLLVSVAMDRVNKIQASSSTPPAPASISAGPFIPIRNKKRPAGDEEAQEKPNKGQEGQ